MADPAPALGQTIQASITAAVRTASESPSVPMSPDSAEVRELTAKTMQVLGDDPKFINSTNSEPWYQSGVGYGGSAAVLGSLIIVLKELQANGFDFTAYELDTLIPALIALAGGAFTLVRRFVPGMVPLFSRWFPKSPM